MISRSRSFASSGDSYGSRTRIASVPVGLDDVAYVDSALIINSWRLDNAIGRNGLRGLGCVIQDQFPVDDEV
jgi:hypothetical protein